MIEDMTKWHVVPHDEKQLFRCPNADTCEEIGRDCINHMHPHQWIEDECTMNCETLDGDVIYENCQPYYDPSVDLKLNDKDLFI